MLAPLARWRPSGSDARALTNQFPDTLSIGRSQMLGLTGPGARALLNELAAAATQPAMGPLRHFSWNPAAGAEQITGSIAACSPAELLLIEVSSNATAELPGGLFQALDRHAERGGGAVIAADELPDHPALNALLRLPLAAPAAPAAHPVLLDDQEMPVRFLREGEWGGALFPIAGQPIEQFQAIRLEVLHASTGKSVWQSDPLPLDAWVLLRPQAGMVRVEFCAAWKPGKYKARLATRPGSAGKWTPLAGQLPILIRPCKLFDIPAGRQPRWRFLEGAVYPPIVAGRNLSAVPRRRLEFGPDELFERDGWNRPEKASEGGLKCWTSGRAIARLGGSAKKLRLDFEDHRPNTTPQDSSTLTLQIDGGPEQSRSWQSHGAHSFDFPWPDDRLVHEIRLRVEPVWSPAALGLNADTRQFGILVIAMELCNDV